VKLRAFTLVEMIMVIVILGVLSTGTFVSLKHLYLRVAKSQALSDLSLDSQIIVNQISALLYDRVPSSVIGYDDNSSKFESIYALNSTYHILEWIGVSSESFKKGDYSGFVDLDDSNATSLTLVSPDTDVSLLASTTQKKFNITNNVFDNNIVSLIFAGTFDDGSIVYSSDFNSTFGWHGNSANRIFNIDNNSSGKNIVLKTKPNEIYEKYYIVDSAYAVARGEDISCRSDANETNTLYFFYNYRPWKGETFCADANVTTLAKEVTGFEIDLLNGSIFFNLTMQRNVPKRGNENPITISKQKVVF